MAGVLYVVATPIGNLEDITVRAARTLAEVDLIACEDTRQTRKLLDHLGCSTPMVSYHDHNERDRTETLADTLRSGKSVALVTDAGTPLVSDPGYRLVEVCRQSGITVTPIPGPSAMLAALSASGLPTDAVYFGGFLTPKSGQRRKALEALRPLEATIVLFEAPHRILELLEDVQKVMGERRVVAAREITKKYEEFLSGTVSEVRAVLAGRESIKGEFTLLIAKSEQPLFDASQSIGEAVAAYERSGLPRMDAIKQVARERGLPKREVYRAVEG